MTSDGTNVAPAMIRRETTPFRGSEPNTMHAMVVVPMTIETRTMPRGSCQLAMIAVVDIASLQPRGREPVGNIQNNETPIGAAVRKG